LICGRRACVFACRCARASVCECVAACRVQWALVRGGGQPSFGSVERESSSAGVFEGVSERVRARDQSDAAGCVPHPFLFLTMVAVLCAIHVSSGTAVEAVVVVPAHAATHLASSRASIASRRGGARPSRQT
jgi:hypothetical protein